jgi:5'-methylthioadenosine phosphorylase
MFNGRRFADQRCSPVFRDNNFLFLIKIIFDSGPIFAIVGKRSSGQTKIRRNGLAQKKKIAPIGIIGGSGLYQMAGLDVDGVISVETPWGLPSDPFMTGSVHGVPVIFLSRHGKGHRYLPTEINYRANIAGLKSLGVERVLSVSAVGSLKEEIPPGMMVVVDDFIDLTKKREMTFYGHGAVGHTGFGDPVCPQVASSFVAGIKTLGYPFHKGGTYVCIEGPAFSTKAESRLYRSWNADVIGMTNATEARLAREAGLCYATLALATDYDCWHPDHDMVTVSDVLAVMHANVEKANRILLEAIVNLPERTCNCASSLTSSLVTDISVIPEKTRKNLTFLGIIQ